MLNLSALSPEIKLILHPVAQSYRLLLFYRLSFVVTVFQAGFLQMWHSNEVSAERRKSNIFRNIRRPPQRLRLRKCTQASIVTAFARNTQNAVSFARDKKNPHCLHHILKRSEVVRTHAALLFLSFLKSTCRKTRNQSANEQIISTSLDVLNDRVWLWDDFLSLTEEGGTISYTQRRSGQQQTVNTQSILQSIIHQGAGKVSEWITWLRSDLDVNLGKEAASSLVKL